MSLLPYVLDNPNEYQFSEDMDYPVKFNEYLNDYLNCPFLGDRYLEPFNPPINISNHPKADKILALLDVREYRPKEITLKVQNQKVILIEGKHEDGSGSFSKQFVKKCVVPQEYETADVRAKVSTDGILFFVVPYDKSKEIYREIPIQPEDPAEAALYAKYY